MGAYFTNHLCIGDLISPIHRYFSVANNFKGFFPPDVLVMWSIYSLAYPLEQSAQFVGVQHIPNILVTGIFPQFSVFKGLSCIFVNCNHLPVKYKFLQVLFS